MGRRTIGSRVLAALAVVALSVGVAPRVFGQDDGGDIFFNTPAGVAVDANGVLRTQMVADPTGALTRQRLAAAKAALDPDVAKPSNLRMVSLNRLEQAIVARNGVPTDEMRYLAGLLRVQYVFFYPESGDIVLAGPAEGWGADLTGRVIGITSGRPVLQLQDLAVALRAFPPSGKKTDLIACSIDPTQEGLAAMQQFLRRVGSTLSAVNVQAQTQYIVGGLRTSLGLQDVTVGGVSPNTHFAQVLVEADYRMKLIGVGMEKPPVKMSTFIDSVNLAQVSRQAMFRWYFLPDYQCVRVSDDGLAMQMVGDGVKLVGEDEVVSRSGERRSAGASSRAAQTYAISFTKKYADLAARSPVYAELRNLIDLSVAAAFIQEQDYYAKAHWEMPFLGSEEQFKVETYQAPVKVEPAVGVTFKGGRLATPIGGGVHIEPQQALVQENLLQDEGGKVAEARGKIQVPEGRWWWD